MQSSLIEARVLVPGSKVQEVYSLAARLLTEQPVDEPQDTSSQDPNAGEQQGATFAGMARLWKEERLDEAVDLCHQLSPESRNLVAFLAGHPDERFSLAQLAEHSGMDERSARSYMAWPNRYAKELKLQPPISSAPGRDARWMKARTAAVFTEALRRAEGNTAV